MKILMFGMSSFPGGIENFIVNYFCDPAVASELDIDFVTYDGTPAFSDRIRECGYRVIEAPHLRRDPVGYRRVIDETMKNGGYDAVYLNMLSAANILPLKAAVKNNIKTRVLHAHANSTVHGALRRILHRLNKKYVRLHASLCLACSNEAGKWLYDGDFTVVPDAVDAARFAFDKDNREQVRHRLGVSDGDFVIGHVGRITEEKNHTFLLDVFSRVYERDKSARLVLVGDGALRDVVRARARELGLEDRVIFCGATDRTDTYYSAFDCFVFPSVFEGFGMALLEAQANGLKCYSSDHLPAILNVTGELRRLPLADGAEKWADAIISEKELCLDKDRMNQTVKNSEFDIGKQKMKLVELLKGE